MAINRPRTSRESVPSLRVLAEARPLSRGRELVAVEPWLYEVVAGSTPSTTVVYVHRDGVLDGAGCGRCRACTARPVGAGTGLAICAHRLAGHYDHERARRLNGLDGLVVTEDYAPERRGR